MSKSRSEDENAWVFDSLVCFLNGPIWDAPMQSFIEEKSLIFEPSVDDDPDYERIFDEFKNLVDFMLGNFMEDIGITHAQFEEACRQTRLQSIHFDPNLFEQIWAANDYQMFKRMMTQRNVELQLQALELIEKKYGVTPDIFIPKKKGDVNKSIQKVTVAVEANNSSSGSNMEREVMEEVAKQFPSAMKDTTHPKEDMEFILEEKHLLENKLKATKEKTVQFKEEPENIPSKPVTPELPPQTNPNDFFLHNKPEIDHLELKKRQEYLRSQRDKLVALKKEVRKNKFDTSKLKIKISRPKSAKAAQEAMSGDAAPLEPQKLQFRKTLAERLKSEVVNKSTE